MAYAFGDGQAVGELAEAAFLLKTGWSWRDYMEAPDALVESMWTLLNAEVEASNARLKEAGRG